MTCHSSRVAITAASASSVAAPGRRRGQRGRHRVRQPGLPRARPSSTASAAIDVSAASAPRTRMAALTAVGEVMNRVSTSTRADSPCWAGTFRSVKMPPTCGFLSAESVPAAPGMPTKSAPTPPGPPQACSAVQPPAAMAARWATAATMSRKATTTVVLSARTNSPALPLSLPAGSVEKTRPPSGGRVAIAAHGMETSRERGAPDTRGAVIWVTCPSVAPCGHAMVAVVCFTGASGASTHSSTPSSPAMTATRRATALGGGTRVDGRRNG